MNDSTHSSTLNKHESDGVSFTSLAAETRNQIYGLTLLQRFPIEIIYLNAHGLTGFRLTLEIDDVCYRNSLNGAAIALRKLTLLNKQIRKEAQTFFYANNAFEFKVEQPLVSLSSHDDIFFVWACVEFLKHCGLDGRASLKNLILEDKRLGTVRHNIIHSNPGIIGSFFHLLSQCKNLEILEINNALAVAPQEMKKRVAYCKAHTNQEVYRRFASRFGDLSRLKKLTLGHEIKHCHSDLHLWRDRDIVTEGGREKQYRLMMKALEHVLTENLSANVEVRTAIGHEVWYKWGPRSRDG